MAKPRIPTQKSSRTRASEALQRGGTSGRHESHMLPKLRNLAERLGPQGVARWAARDEAALPAPAGYSGPREVLSPQARGGLCPGLRSRTTRPPAATCHMPWDRSSSQGTRLRRARRRFALETDLWL